MRIIFDCVSNSEGFPVGFHTIETDDPQAIETLKTLQADKTKLAQAGYAELSKLPGITEGMRRWDVIVLASTRTDADPKLKALKLTI